MGRVVSQAPRAPQPTVLSKAAMRIQANRQAAQQQAVYAPQAWVRPATVDPASSDPGTGILVSTTSGMHIMRLKGITRSTPASRVEWWASTGASCVMTAIVSLFEYSDDGGVLALSEIARSSARHSISASDQRLSNTLPVPIVLSPEKKYAAGISVVAASGTFSVHGAGANVSSIKIQEPSGQPVAFQWAGVDNGDAEWALYAAGYTSNRPMLIIAPEDVISKWY